MQAVDLCALRASHRLCCKLGPALKSKFNWHSNVQEYIRQVEEYHKAWGAILIARQVDWVDKYFQIGSVYYFTQSDSEKQIGYRGGILFVAPYFVWVLEIYFSYSRGHSGSPHNIPSALILCRAINIFLSSQRCRANVTRR